MIRIREQMLVEVKMLRLYAVSIMINMILIPVSYVIIMLISLGAKSGELSYQLSGFMVASLIGSMVTLLALRVSSMAQADVLELYAALPVTLFEIVIAQVATYLLLALPQVAVSLLLSILNANASVNILVTLVGFAMSVSIMAALGVALGLSIRNPYIAQGIIPMLSFAILLLSPVYYRAEALPVWARAVLLVNPVTHALNVMRTPLGFASIIPQGYSYLFLIAVMTLLIVYAVTKLRKVYILEKLF